jgi:hypothetical protein
MPHFKTPTDDIVFLSADDVATGWGRVLPDGAIGISDAEAAQLAASKSAAPRNIAAEIDARERQHMLPRPVRDSLLAIAEKEAAALGYTPPQLRTVNAGYRKVKELDEQIAALRGQM